MPSRQTLLLLSALLPCCASSNPPNPPDRGAEAAREAEERTNNLHARMEAFRHLADADGQGEATDETVWRVSVAGAPAKGGSQALVTIVEFGDFQCGYCVRAESTISRLLAAYGEDLRVVWRDDPLPFHDRARAAATLARRARAARGDAGFWEAHDALLGLRGNLGDDALAGVARRVGLDPALPTASTSAEDDALDGDLEVADDVDAEGTPTFFINGKRLVGAQPIETFRTLIDAEIVRAQALVKQGTPRAAVYDALVKEGRVAPAPPTVQVAVPAGAPVRGNPAATLVIQEFADFQCPYCASAEEVMRQVLSRYGSSVKLVWRDLPLSMHPYAEAAAEAAAEARAQKGDAGFWSMHDLLLANQGRPHGLESDALSAYARQIGLDVPAFEKALSKRSHAAEVTLNAKAAAAAGIRSTPVFVVGDYVVDGAQPFVRFRKLIRRATGG